MDQGSTHRLPRTVSPLHYDLELAPDLAASTFSGVVTVTIDVFVETSEVVLNSADLEIEGVRLTTADGTERPGSAEAIDGQRVVLRFDPPVPAGAGQRLTVAFAGVLDDKLHGFYRSTFVDDHGDVRVIATTQFEPADARRAFPCWDEPDMKATFAVTLVVDDDLTAISNGGIVSEEATGDGRRRVGFATTMAMSTYLVAFVVGPFELTDPLDVDGVPLRVATPPGRSQLTSYAVEAGAHALRFLARYFDLAYPHDKIDHVAIPDFAFGAMENLGCVTYRENALLVDVDTASQPELQRVATVVAHETAHMWFGDLVTMKWWNGIWLNEAFATFMELLTTDALRPDWEVWTTFGTGKAEAMVTDGLRTTRPVEFEVARPEDAEAMFDVLTYQKGGAVLRMLEQYLGPEIFRQGISRYLAEHQYANTETSDLWDAVEAVSGEPVSHIMESWIFQGGYPLLSLSPGPDDHSVKVTQEPFAYSGAPSRGAASGGVSPPHWVVPVNVRASVEGEIVHHKLLLDGESVVVRFEGRLDWCLLNDGGWGFYRVHYSSDLRSRLLGALAKETSALERMALIGDTWALVMAGRSPLSELTTVLGVLGDEDDPDAWSAMLSPLRLLDLVVSDTERAALRAFVRDLVAPAFARVGWDPVVDEPRRSGVLRSRLISALGVLGADPEVRSEAARRFALYCDDHGGLAPDVVTATVHVVVAAGGLGEWETVFELYRAATNPQERLRYLSSLTASDQPELLERLLDATLSPDVRSQDAPGVIAGVLGSRPGGAMAWGWLEAHWDELRGRLPDNMLIRALEGITGLVGDGLSDDVHAWVAAVEVPVGGPRLAQLEERLDINVALRQRLDAQVAVGLDNVGLDNVGLDNVGLDTT